LKENAERAAGVTKCKESHQPRVSIPRVRLVLRNLHTRYTKVYMRFVGHEGRRV